MRNIKIFSILHFGYEPAILEFCGYLLPILKNIGPQKALIFLKSITDPALRWGFYFSILRL